MTPLPIQINIYFKFQNEEVDESLSLEQLNDINGVGLGKSIKDKADDSGDWLAGKLGDVDGKHERKGDYLDDAFKDGIGILEILRKKQ